MICAMHWPRDYCYECDRLAELCPECQNCDRHCECQQDLFDADELGIDPEVDAERFENA